MRKFITLIRHAIDNATFYGARQRKNWKKQAGGTLTQVVIQ
ncbi:hypothetical protein [Chitinophaga silvisoli]|nr:hypothetical protein [Chitinophaga silvisoli]